MSLPVSPQREKRATQQPDSPTPPLLQTPPPTSPSSFALLHFLLPFLHRFSHLTHLPDQLIFLLSNFIIRDVSQLEASVRGGWGHLEGRRDGRKEGRGADNEEMKMEQERRRRCGRYQGRDGSHGRQVICSNHTERCLSHMVRLRPGADHCDDTSDWHKLHGYAVISKRCSVQMVEQPACIPTSSSLQ